MFDYNIMINGIIISIPITVVVNDIVLLLIGPHFLRLFQNIIMLVYVDIFFELF